MATSPTDRDRAVATYRQAGHTLQQTAREFKISPNRVQAIDSKVRREREAHEKLRDDPGDLEAMAICGTLRRNLQTALEREGIRHVEDFRHLTLHHRRLFLNVGPKGRQEIVELARKWGIEFPAK